MDISRFIRSGDDRDLGLFWLDIAKGKTPSVNRHAHRQELCSVPFLKVRDWLCGEETKTNRKPRLRGGMRAWTWDWIDGTWRPATRANLLPGRVVCVAADTGGYRVDLGFDAKSKEPVALVALPPLPRETLYFDEADDRQDGEQISFAGWKTVACHTAEVLGEAREIAEQLGLTDDTRAPLEIAATWHDWGKSHPAFQGTIRGAERPARLDLAKAPEDAWCQPPNLYKYLDGSDARPGFRHELASALALFGVLRAFAPQHPALLGPWIDVLTELGKSPAPVRRSSPSPLVQRVLDCSAEAFDLVTYLVASHHGKVRVALHAAPRDQEYRDRDGRGLPIRGVREGDILPGIEVLPGESAP
ncbi:MAG: CRISPR-associated endonuclease Cas3'', partial [Terriglobia bacterium]